MDGHRSAEGHDLGEFVEEHGANSLWQLILIEDVKSQVVCFGPKN